MMMKSMYKKAVLATFSAVLLSLAGCASVPNVMVAMDRNADFSQYKTFAFVSPLGTDKTGYQSIVSQELKLSTQRELEARGMRLVVESPQLLVNFNTSMEDKTRVTTMPTLIGFDAGNGFYGNFGLYGGYFGGFPGSFAGGFPGGYYGYRSGLYAPWPLYVDQTTVTQYKEGTLNIDVVDAARKQLVWEGVVTERVTQRNLRNLALSINTAVTAAFAKYPVQPIKPTSPMPPTRPMLPTESVKSK